MVQAIKISPVKKDFDSKFKTFESSLANNGYSRFPSTHTFLTPNKEADGRYRTGVDEKAVYLTKLNDEERKIELDAIKELKTRLKAAFGDIDFGPRSTVWNAYMSEDDERFQGVKATALKVGNGDIILNPDLHPQQLLDYCWLRVNKSVARSAEAYARGECPTCTFYVQNDEVENQLLYSKKMEVNQATADLISLTPAKRKQIGRLMMLPITDSTTNEAIYNMIDSTLKKVEFDSKELRTMQPIKFFKELVRMSDDLLYTKDIVEQAFRNNVYRKGTGDTVMKGTEVVFESRDEFVRHLMKTENQKELLSLAKMLEVKKAAELI